MINDIQSKQETKVEKRIKEFIDMEQLVFTQDKVLQQKLNFSDIPQKTGMDSCDENLYDDDDTIFNSKGCALLDTRKLVPDKLVLYYEVGCNSYHEMYLFIDSDSKCIWISMYAIHLHTVKMWWTANV